MPHPAFFSHTVCSDEATRERYRRVTGYLVSEHRRVRSFGGHRHYHRPLSRYVERLATHGFALTGLYEPAAPLPDGRPESAWTNHDCWSGNIPTMVGMVAELHSRPGRRARPG